MDRYSLNRFSWYLEGSNEGQVKAAVKVWPEEEMVNQRCYCVSQYLGNFHLEESSCMWHVFIMQNQEYWAGIFSLQVIKDFPESNSIPSKRIFTIQFLSWTRLGETDAHILSMLYKGISSQRWSSDYVTMVSWRGCDCVSCIVFLFVMLHWWRVKA